ncbi:MAG TPA: phosphoribosylglycinamide formyltransferase [Clostridia bacterium]|nr:phosphoribosylglycinamide formyltransferase [Clostridia bacterium]
MKNIGVFISGGGSNLQTIIEAIDNGDIAARISLVISSRKGVYGLDRAKEHGIPYAVVAKGDYKDPDSFSKAILELLEEKRVDLVVLAGYLNILPKKVVERYKNRIINIHPSLIPAFCGRGYYGKRVHQAVLDYGARVTGATVHLVDEGTDTGPIILQQPVEVLPEDDADSLAKRVLKVEHQLLPKALRLLTEDRISVDGRRVIIKNT